MILILILNLYAQTVLFEKKTTLNEETIKSKIYRGPAAERSGNLPSYMSSKNSFIDTVTIVNKKGFEFSSLFKTGKFYEISVLSDIYAYQGEKTEVLGVYSDGIHQITVSGVASLNPSRDSVNVTFNSFFATDKKYDFIARGLDPSKAKDLRAKYESNETGYFIGDMLSTTVAAYFDARVTRNTNQYGNQVEDTSVDSALKRGASAAFLESADRFKERSKNDKPYGFIAANTNLTMFVIKKGETR